MIKEKISKFCFKSILILSLLFSAFAVSFLLNKTPTKTEVLATSDVASASENTSSVEKWVDGKGNVCTNLGKFSGGTTFTINSIDENADKSYISNYTVTINGTTYTPIPQNGYKVIGISFYDDNETKQTKTSGTFTTEDLDPKYTGKITVKAETELITYKAYMYYSTDGATWQEKCVEFNVENTTELNNVLTEEEKDADNRIFGHWAILADSVTSSSTDLGFVKVNNIQFNLSDDEFTCVTSQGGGSFYYISSVTGYSSTINNFKITDYTFPNNDSTNWATINNKATIRATWSYIYNGVIDNDYSGMHYKEDENLIGALSHEDTTESYKTASLKFADSEDYTYKFKQNTGIAFNKKGDFSVSAKTDNIYEVYNYGYDLIGWQVFFGYGTKSMYFKYDREWEIVDSENTISCSTLQSTDTAQLTAYMQVARKLNDFFLSGYNNIEIHLKPVWEETTIKVVENTSSTEIATTSYNGEYSITDNSGTCPIGKTLYYYTTSSGNIIAKQYGSAKTITWNYTEISCRDFTYDAIYILTVKPEYVDDIYKVNLTGVKETLNNSKTYELDSANTNYLYTTGETRSQITVFDAGLGFHDYSSGSVEKYIEDVVTPNLTTYNNQISAGEYQALRKVYTTVSNASGNSVTSESAPDFWIYLANNQTAGKLPVFKTDYYTLIAWEDNYSYITKLYNSTDHTGALNKTLKNINDDEIDGNSQGNWTLDQMSGSVGGLNFSANYFRKSYLLDLNTLRDGTTNNGRYGYLYLGIEDKLDNTASAKGARIIVMFDNANSTKEYYNISTAWSEDGLSLDNLTFYSITSSYVSVGIPERLLKEVEIEGVTTKYIKLYAGCDVTIKASCIDDLSDTSYADMVGYYLKSINNTISVESAELLFDNVSYSNITDKTAGSHLITLSANAIEDKGYPNNTKITINANFAPIDYNLTITLDNPNSGLIYYKGQNTIDGKKELKYKNVNVENWDKTETIEYFAQAGYTLQNSAITTINKLSSIKILLGYNKDEATGTDNSKKYNFKLDGNWLLKYYYGVGGTYDARTYSEEPTTDGQDITINVNTEVLTFKYFIEVVDKNSGSILSNYQSGTMQLDGSTTSSNNVIITAGDKEFPGEISQALVGQEFTTLDGTYYIIEVGGTKYAILTSYLQGLNSNENYAISYDFMLSSLSTNNYNFTQVGLTNIYGNGTIVSPVNRTLTMQIDVAELYTITLKATAHTNPDSNDTIRSTKITNGKGKNSITLETGINSKYDENEKAIIYTYEGAENSLSSTYDNIRYSGVIYKWDGSELTTSQFTLDRTHFGKDNEDAIKNSNITVTYIPSPISTFDVTYKKEGVEDSSVRGDIIEDVLPSQTTNLYMNQSVTYKFKLISTDYTVSVYLNGAEQNLGTIDSDGYYNLTCIVDSSVYNAKGFYVIVNVTKIPTGSIAIKYVLDNNITASADDDYGSLQAYVNNIETTVTEASANTFMVTVPQNAKVEVDLSLLNNGYHFVKCGTTETLTDNKLTLIDSYDLSKATYYITIAKDTICATLTVEGSYKDKYTMSTTGIETEKILGTATQTKTQINAYLGKTITFTDVDENREVLDHYYYTDKDANSVEITDLQLVLNADLLENLTKTGNVYELNIGVVRTPKYNLTYNIVNNQFVEESKSYVGDDEEEVYITKTNMIAGTNINVYVLAKNTTETDSKYNITVTGDYEETTTNGVFEHIFTLDSDVNITITIAPKSFSDGTSYEEYIYNNLQDYKNGTPTQETELSGGFNLSNDLSFGASAVATLSIKTAKGELSSVTISGNDQDTFVVYFAGKRIVKLYNQTTETEYAISSDYATDDDTEITNPTEILNQAGYKLEFINVTTEQLKISYTVSNAISISATYLSYKYITVL